MAPLDRVARHTQSHTARGDTRQSTSGCTDSVQTPLTVITNNMGMTPERKTQQANKDVEATPIPQGQEPLGGADSASFPPEMLADSIDFAATSHSRNNSLVIPLGSDPSVADPLAAHTPGINRDAEPPCMLGPTPVAHDGELFDAPVVLENVTQSIINQVGISENGNDDNAASAVGHAHINLFPTSPALNYAQRSPLKLGAQGQAPESNLPSNVEVTSDMANELANELNNANTTTTTTTATVAEVAVEAIAIEAPVNTTAASPQQQQQQHQEDQPELGNFLVKLALVADVFPEELQNGLNEIVLHCPHKNFVLGDSMLNEAVDYGRSVIPMAFVKNPNFIQGRSAISAMGIQRLKEYEEVTGMPNRLSESQLSTDSDRDLESLVFIVVEYGRVIDAFRALGNVFGAILGLENPHDLIPRLQWEETCQFDTSGVMIDCSRCAVLTIQSAFFLLRTCALLGMNTFQLYTEDTYEVKNEPFFGYLRGKFSQEEITMIDDYAFNLGIEVIPCIQTLGHLGQILQWPRFASMKDTHEVLLAESEETYGLIEEMIAAATKPLRTNRIHIGMDEAHGVGEGRYRQVFGSKDSTDVFLAHLQKVNEICVSKGLKPMIWSDMLFSLAAKDNSLQSYYGDASLPPKIGKKMPDNITLVYWDYYHIQEEAYARKIQHHRELGCEPWVAGGIWTWNRFVTALPFTIAAATACLRAAKKENVRNIFVTIWGDDGNEVDIMSALPGLILYGEHSYTSNDDILLDVLKNKFTAICGGNFDDFIYASKIDLPPGAYDRTRFPPNMSKWLMWQDPFYSFLSPQMKGIDLVSYYKEIADRLDVASAQSNDYPLNYRLRFPALIARTLVYKCTIREQIVAAYSKPNSKETLVEILSGPLYELRKNLENLWRYHRSLWLATYKPFGLEILEMRYGAIKTRIQSMHERLCYYCFDTYNVSHLDLPPAGTLSERNGTHWPQRSTNTNSAMHSLSRNVKRSNDSMNLNELDALPPLAPVTTDGVDMREKMSIPDFGPMSPSTLSPGRASVGLFTNGKPQLGDPIQNFNNSESGLPDILNTFPEFKTELNELYGGGVELVLEFARAYTPCRAMGTG